MATPRIMVVEDEKIAAGLLAGTLEDLGYEVASVVSSGEDAVSMAEAVRPDLILADIMLEGEMDGIEAVSLIRSRFHIPVIYLTAYSEDPLLDRAKATHPDGCLVKPIRPEELHANIEIALAKREIEQRLVENERRYRAIVEDQTELICRYLPSGALTFVNEAYCRYFNKTGRTLSDRYSSCRLLNKTMCQEEDILRHSPRRLLSGPMR